MLGSAKTSISPQSALAQLAYWPTAYQLLAISQRKMNSGRTCALTRAAQYRRARQNTPGYGTNMLESRKTWLLNEEANRCWDRIAPPVITG